jgi:hypothetical protein
LTRKRAGERGWSAADWCGRGRTSTERKGGPEKAGRLRASRLLTQRNGFEVSRSQSKVKSKCLTTGGAAAVVIPPPKAKSRGKQNPRLLSRSGSYGGPASTCNIRSAGLSWQRAAVPTVRFELTRALAPRLAGPLRLPIPPRGHSCFGLALLAIRTQIAASPTEGRMCECNESRSSLITGCANSGSEKRDTMTGSRVASATGGRAAALAVVRAADERGNRRMNADGRPLIDVQEGR